MTNFTPAPLEATEPAEEPEEPDPPSLLPASSATFDPPAATRHATSARFAIEDARVVGVEPERVEVEVEPRREVSFRRFPREVSFRDLSVSAAAAGDASFPLPVSSFSAFSASSSS